jgi:hypothetical protein
MLRNGRIAKIPTTQKQITRQATLGMPGKPHPLPSEGRGHKFESCRARQQRGRKRVARAGAQAAAEGVALNAALVRA